MQIVQINLQSEFGGGEVYTGFLCKALDRLGVSTLLLHHPEASFWKGMGLPESTQLRPAGELLGALPSTHTWVITHGPLRNDLAYTVAADHLLTGIAHMPPQGRPSDRYAHYRCVFGVSGYVVQGLRGIGVPVWDAPLYGVANLHRATTGAALRQTSCYQWDKRKGRDRLLGWIEPWLEPLRKRPLFERRPGISLGIVSRLTPIKQFPQLFEIIAPIIAQHANLHLEIFGAGGYASVRDLKRATRPLGSRVRFWGHQRDVVAVYRQLDFLLTGLPEKEALGLNVIEAQDCGLPVLGVNAPPFTETILHGKTGLLYTDPRLDHGEDFANVMRTIVRHPFRVGEDAAVREHLAHFSEPAFTQRIADVVAHFRPQLEESRPGAGR